MKILVVIFCIIMAVLPGVIFSIAKDRDYWKQQAISNARARIRKNEAVENEVGQINRKAAAAIAKLNADNEELRDEVKRLRNMNRNLLKQLNRRKEHDDVDDS